MIDFINTDFADLALISAFVVITGLTMNLMPSKSVMNTEKLPIATDGTRLETKLPTTVKISTVIIITSPIWFGLMCAFAAIALAILCALLSIIIAVFATGFSLTIGGIVTLFTVYPAGIALIGAGLICIGLGGMIVMPVIRCIWRGCVSLFNKFTNFVHRFVSSKAVA